TGGARAEKGTRGATHRTMTVDGTSGPVDDSIAAVNGDPCTASPRCCAPRHTAHEASDAVDSCSSTCRSTPVCASMSSNAKQTCGHSGRPDRNGLCLKIDLAMLENDIPCLGKAAR